MPHAASAPAELLVLRPGPPRRIPLAGVALIGRDAGCHVRLADPAVAPIHGRVSLIDGLWRLQAESPAPPFRVNGRTAAEAVLADCDVIELGDNAIGFRRNADASLASPARTAAEERDLLECERLAWEAELARQRRKLVEREVQFREGAARAGKALAAAKDRNRRERVELERRASEIRHTADRLAERKNRLDLTGRELAVQRSHLDEQFRKLESERSSWCREQQQINALVLARRDEAAELAERVAELRRQLSQGGEPRDLGSSIQLEIAASPREREIEEAAAELERMAERVERLLECAESGPGRPRLRVVHGDAAPTEHRVDLVDWADNLLRRRFVDDWWDARAAEFNASVRAWRESAAAEKTAQVLAGVALRLKKDSLDRRELTLARETASQRCEIDRAREALDRRRSWLERSQEQLLRLRLTTNIDIAARQAAIEDAWSEFRSQILQERLELLCERERQASRDRELVRLRRLAAEQQDQLIRLFSERRAHEEIATSERTRSSATIADLEAAVDRFAYALLDSGEERAASPTPARRRKAA